MTVPATPLLTQTFDGADGSLWPAPVITQAAGGATLDGSRVQGGRGRHTLPGTVGHATLAGRYDGLPADHEGVVQVGGQFDNTSITTREHYREVHWRLDPTTGSAASSTATSYLITMHPSETNVGFWRVMLRRRRAGTTTMLAPFQEQIPAATRDMTVRWRAEGARLRAKVWPTTGAEPSAWNFDVTDTAPILTGGSVALVSVGASSPLYVDYDDLIVLPATAGPTLTVSGPSRALWPQPFGLAAFGSGFTSLNWTILERPAGSIAVFDNPSSATPTFTPDRAGRYRFRAAATGTSGTSSGEVTVRSLPIFWQYNASGTLLPVKFGTFGTGTGGGFESDFSGGF